MRHQRLLFSLPEPFFDGLFNSGQTNAILILSEFTDTTNTPVAQVINIINLTIAIAQVNQYFDYRQNIFITKHHSAR